ncbi:MAG: hypothetical protein JNL60_02840 [Bacteroidia bacterium]|nr:hypothetical protein [Bacteroidia bacterium]
METGTEDIKPKRSFFKKLLRIFFWGLVICFLGIVSLIGILFVYQDEVKSTIINELNKHLDAEVRIDPKNIDLTIISTFPDCSIEFKEVLMLEALPIKDRDTLMFAGRLNLHFNIKDIWEKKYQIKKIKLKDGLLKLRVLKNGSNNYTFWKKDKNNVDKNGSVNFDLKLVEIENTRLNYKDRKHIFKTELEIESLSFAGRFNDNEYDLKTDASIKVSTIAQAQTTYLKNKNCKLSLDLNVSGDNYEFRKAALRINRLELDLKGDFSYRDSLQDLDLSYKASNLEISSILSLLPDRHRERISDYESSGNLYAGGRIKYSNKKVYSVESDFGIQNAKIFYKPESTTAENVNIEGHLKITGASSLLELKNIELRLGGDELKGSCVVRNFSDPLIKFKAQASVNLENIQKFWPIDTLNSIKGKLDFTSEAEGLLRDLRDKTFSTNVRVYLNAHVSGLEAQFKHDEKIYAVGNCSLIAGDREIEVKDLTLKRGSSTIKINGKIPGLFNHLVDRGYPLTIIGSIYSDNLRMEDFLQNGYSNASGSQNNTPLIPDNLICKLNAAIMKFSFGKFEANSLTGEIEIKRQKAMISEMKFNAMEGDVEINAFADNSRGKLEIVLQSNLKGINISTMFAQLNNFGQQTLEDNNLKGYGTATVDFSGNWNNNLVADLSSIKANCNLSIQKGELIDFKPLGSLSRFVELDDLKRVKFSSLQSNIEIKNKIIQIPKTSIKNSALDIEVWGTHSFNNDIDYHIQLLISDLLSKKRRSQDSEFGPIEKDNDNKRSAFILMTGTIDNPVIKYDRKGLKEKIGSDIKKEKQNLKQVLKEEFGLFKKDSLPEKKKNSDQEFELEKPNAQPTKKGLELKKKEDEDDF